MNYELECVARISKLVSRSYHYSVSHQYRSSGALYSQAATQSEKSSFQEESALMHQVRDLYRSGKYEDAQRALKSANVKLSDLSVDMACLAGEIEFSLSNFAEATAYYNQACTSDFSKVGTSPLVHLAHIYSTHGHQTQATEILLFKLASLSSRPASEEEESLDKLLDRVVDKCAKVEGVNLLLNELARSYHWTGELESARASCAASLKIDPKQREVQLQFISLLLHEASISHSKDCGALAASEAAEAVFPDDIEIKQYKLRSLFQAMKMQEIVDELETWAKENRKSNLDARLMPFRITSFVALGRYEESDTLYEQLKAGSMKENNIFGLLELARAACVLEHHSHVKGIVMDEIASDFTKLKIHEKDQLIDLIMADVDNPKLSTWVLQQLIKHHPTHVHYLRQLALSEFDMNRFENSLKVWSRISDLVPLKASDECHIGDLYLAQNKFEEALAQFRMIQRRKDDKHSIEEAKAKETFTLLKLKQYDDAIAKYESIVGGKEKEDEKLASGEFSTDTALLPIGFLFAGEMIRHFGNDHAAPSKYTDLERAVRVLKAAVSESVKFPKDPAVTHEILAKTLIKLGRSEEADEHTKLAGEYTEALIDAKERNKFDPQANA